MSISQQPATLLQQASALLNPIRSMKQRILRQWRERQLQSTALRSLRPLQNSDVRQIPVFCISLPDATSRQANIRRQMTRLGFTTFRFFPAVNGRAKSTTEWEAEGLYDAAAARQRFGDDLSRPNIGCTLSHVNVLKAIVESGLPQAIVVEDDVLLDAARLDELDLSQLPPNWDILFLTALYAETPPKEPVTTGIYGFASYAGSTAAYLVSARGAKKLLQYALPVSWAADGFVGVYMRDVVTHLEGIEYGAYLLWPPAARNGSLDGSYVSAIQGAAS